MSDGIRAGEILAGKYRVERVLGRGGMGVVVAARHLRLDELVAIKFLLPDAERNPERIERFSREARAASKIKSEHVARVTDVDTTEAGTTYMVMELLEGMDLADALEARGPFPVERAATIGIQICEAMAEAHAMGIVHRDLKLENVFLVEGPEERPAVKVLDFGISKLLNPQSGSDRGLTHTRAIVGSPHYMSPEQLLSSRTVDARTDIWALGVSLYQLLTGRLPFSGDTMPETCALVMQAQPTSPRSLRPEIPAELERTVLRCLSKGRDERFASMAELAIDLLPFAPEDCRRWVERAARLQGAPSEPRLSLPEHSARTPSSDAGRAPVMAEWPTLEATSMPSSVSRPRRRWAAAAGGLAAGALAVAIGVGTMGSGARTAGGALSSGPAALAAPPPAAPAAATPDVAPSAASASPAPPDAPDAPASSRPHAPQLAEKAPRAVPKAPMRVKARPAAQPVEEDTIGF
jgi:serine/threonine protein kinase